MKTTLVIGLALAAFALSLTWTLAPESDALGSLVKYGKLLLIPLMLLTLRDRQEAVYALVAFAAAQVFLLASSWMLFAQLTLPWATSHMALTQYAVFSSYLDQGILSAVFASICWHLRAHVPGRYGQILAISMAIAALSNVLFVLMGRTAHAVSIALVSLAIMWALPKRYRAIIVAIPFVLAAALFFMSDKVRDRLTLVQTEISAYSVQNEPGTSTGIRLNLWNTALQSIGQRPLAGSGIGSWSTEFNRIQHEKNPAHVDIAGNGNPHQEFLLWGVQLGLPGIVLFIALLLAILHDSLKMEVQYARATQSTLLALTVSCLFNSSLYDAQIGDFFCILLGLLMALGRQKPSELHIATLHPRQIE
jgi:O-antigen ligase